MERFKVLEKETKTKAYSKEGLNGMGRGRHRSGSNDSGMDPREDPAKRDTFIWLDSVEDALNSQLAEMDEKMEDFKATSKKKKTSAATTDAMMDDLQTKMNRHQHHIDQIQLIKDRLEHDELAVALVEEIHDDLDYYVNSHNEADFQEDETLYDALELDKEVERSESRDDADAAPADDDENAIVHTEEEQAQALAQAQEELAASASEEDAAAGTVEAIFRTAGAKASPTKARPAQSKPAASPLSSPPATSPAAAAAAAAKGRVGAGIGSASQPTPIPVVVPTPTAGKGDTLASIIAKNQKVAAPTATTGLAASPQLAAAAAPGKTGMPPQMLPMQQQQPQPPQSSPQSSPQQLASKPGPLAPSAIANPPQMKSTGLPMIAPSQLGRLPPGGVKPPSAQQSMMPPPGLSSQTPPPGLGTGVVGPPAAAAAAAAELAAALAPQSNMPPVGVFAKDRLDRSLVPDDYLHTLSLLEPSLRHLPEPVDSERPKQYIPRNPYRTPSYFPSVPAPIFDDPLLFDKLSVDTLFFIFYFQQGTPHQYLAARELKKQSWRYHKNFLTWFQRHDDPKITTEEYEQGTYVYFDYESGWCQRIKADFTFEYRHLEDELQVPIAATI